MTVRQQRAAERRLLHHFAERWARHGGNEVADGLVQAMVVTDELLERMEDPSSRKRAATAIAERVEEIRRATDAQVLELLVSVAREVGYETPPPAEDRPVNVVDFMGALEALVVRPRAERSQPHG
jgi:hypothetical protein